MANLSTNLLAHQARLLAEMIESLPVCLSPVDQRARCQELLDQLDWALDELSDSALGGGMRSH